ncbi:MAG: DUF6036 family nucleotidyltransferase [Candidatus Thermoplasmatota archaeon]
MDKREEEIAELLEFLCQRSEGFTKPRMILLGGYALRAYTEYSRYTRDCDFVMQRETGWNINKIKNWLGNKINLENFETRETYGFARFVKTLRIGKKRAKIALDFMEGEVRGRANKDIVAIDEKFIEDSERVEIQVGTREIKFFVPAYRDYFILKVVSARPSDVRDIAALVLKSGVPDCIDKRIKEILPYPDIFTKNIHDVIISQVSHKRFVDSWRGTFVTSEFDEERKHRVLRELRIL